jgi:glyceraldehyde 3-phosphate dehydrogenase
MTTRIAINGFGRIGRQVTKAFFEKYRGEFDLVAINDLTSVATNAHLFKYDSNYGQFPGTVEVVDGDLVIDGDRIKVLAERDRSQLPWGDLGRRRQEGHHQCTGQGRRHHHRHGREP